MIISSLDINHLLLSMIVFLKVVTHWFVMILEYRDLDLIIVRGDFMDIMIIWIVLILKWLVHMLFLQSSKVRWRLVRMFILKRLSCCCRNLNLIVDLKYLVLGFAGFSKQDWE